MDRLFLFFIGDIIMQQVTPTIPRTEQAIFNLLCLIDEFYDLKHEFSIQDIAQIEQEVERFRSILQRKQSLPLLGFPCTV